MVRPPFVIFVFVMLGAKWSIGGVWTRLPASMYQAISLDRLTVWMEYCE
jgi:hypothetical protein